MSDELDRLRSQLREVQIRIDEIESAKRADENDALVGKCFKYRNSYSCPQSENDKWWMYRRVISVSPSGYLQVFQFQVDKDGKFECEETTTRSAGNLGTPITLKQFQHAWKITARMLNSRATLSGAYQP